MLDGSGAGGHLGDGGAQGQGGREREGAAEAAAQGHAQCLLVVPAGAHHHRRHEDGHLHAHRGRRGRGGVFAVRGLVHLPRNPRARPLRHRADRRQDLVGGDVPRGRGAGQRVAADGGQHPEPDRRADAALHRQPDAVDGDADAGGAGGGHRARLRAHGADPHAGADAEIGRAHV